MASNRPEADAPRDTPEADPPAEQGREEPRASEPEPGDEAGTEAARDSSPPGSDRPSQPPSDKEGPRRRFEHILPGLIRRGIEKGIEAGLSTFERSIETGRGTTDAVRGVFSEVKVPRDIATAVGRAVSEARLPRELASAVFNQLDETKNDVLRIVAREVREFLDATDLASELKAALTSLSFEIRTEVRFIPNEAGTGVRPNIRARSRLKQVERERRMGRKRTRRPRHEAARENDGEE